MLNKVILIGNLGQDPDIRSLPSGNRVANFSVATTEFWKDKTGQRQSSTEWHKVVSYNENIVKLAERLHKGSKVYVEGAIKSRKYVSSDGVERTIVEIIIDTIKLLDPKQGDKEGDHGAKDSHHGNHSSHDDSGNKADHEEDLDDDKIPF